MSTYFAGLKPSQQSLYLNKLNCLGFGKDSDPFLQFERRNYGHSGWEDNVKKWPTLELPAIVFYLLDSVGPFTKESLQAYRSLDAYNFYLSGWVQTTYYKAGRKGTCILAAKVNRSQAVTETPHQAWFGVKSENDQTNIVTAHCTCMAGLGEVCSHVAAVMFKVQRAAVLSYNSVACTDMPCTWNQNFTTKVEAVPLSEIIFDKPNINEDPALMSSPVHEEEPDDPTEILNDLKNDVPNSNIFSMYASNEPSAPKLPIRLDTLYDDQLSSSDQGRLESVCEETLHLLSKEEQPKYVHLEKVTRKQVKSKLWHKFRIGRVTASRMHDVCHTDIENPSDSLIKSICYGTSFSTPATRWGNQQEDKALSAYTQKAKSKHSGLKVSKSGLVLDPNNGFIGASPDAIVECKCCGKGVVEIKCSFKFKNDHPCEVTAKEFWLNPHDKENSIDCNGALKYNHRYFAQIQTQMAVCDTFYCDFVTYSLKGIHIERVNLDYTYYLQMLTKATLFFKKVLLPELLTGERRKKSTTEKPKRET